jgi:hypothetical protein
MGLIRAILSTQALRIPEIVHLDSDETGYGLQKFIHQHIIELQCLLLARFEAVVREIYRFNTGHIRMRGSSQIEAP